jgi:hypothetical protein
MQEPVDLDTLAARLLSVVARMRSAVHPNEHARAEVEYLAAAVEATVNSALAREVGVTVLRYEIKWLLYTSEGAVETRMRTQPRAIATHVAFRQAIERKLRDAPSR